MFNSKKKKNYRNKKKVKHKKIFYSKKSGGAYRNNNNPSNEGYGSQPLPNNNSNYTINSESSNTLSTLKVLNQKEKDQFNRVMRQSVNGVREIKTKFPISHKNIGIVKLLFKDQRANTKLAKKYDKIRNDIFYNKIKPLFEFILMKFNDKELLKYKKYNLDTWGVIPGQTLSVPAGILTKEKDEHHVLYLGCGLIIEIGSGLDAHLNKWCFSSSESGYKTYNLYTCVGINTLEHLLLRSNNNLKKVDYTNFNLQDDFPSKIRNIYQMVLRILDVNNKEEVQWPYNPYSANCQHFVTYLTFGEKKFTQKSNVYNYVTNSCSRTKRQFISGKDCVSNCIKKTPTCKDKECLNITVSDLGICRNSKGELAPPHRKLPNLLNSYCYIGKKCISKNSSKCLRSIRTEDAKYGCEKGNDKINKCIYTNDFPPYK